MAAFCSGRGKSSTGALSFIETVSGQNSCIDIRMNFLIALDKAGFLFINRSLANPVFDAVMPIITNADYWRIPLFAAWLALMIFGGKRGRIAGLLAVIVLAMSDQLSSAVVKPLVGRLRPCHPDVLIEGGRFLMGQKTSFSFTSSHAANNASVATLFAVKYPRTKGVFIGITAAVSFSRIYVGVHYPFDVLGGIALGILCAVIILGLERGIRTVLKNRRRDPALSQDWD